MGMEKYGRRRRERGVKRKGWELIQRDLEREMRWRAEKEKIMRRKYENGGKRLRN